MQNGSPGESTPATGFPKIYLAYSGESAPLLHREGDHRASGNPRHILFAGLSGIGHRIGVHVPVQLDRPEFLARFRIKRVKIAVIGGSKHQAAGGYRWS